ncbi:MAG TPA: P-loop NTPase fold protein, partial [Spirochaetota bacterium]|nr:P-loop NTPase fold protein [Spirochaetota bacterium]
MKHQHIIEIIQEYVQTNDTDYALMINGKWGSGKTYFIKNHLMKSLTANKPIYVSFNGLNKIENISTKILISYFNIDEKINLGIDVIQTLLELGDEIKYLNVITKATQGIKAIYKKIKFKRLELSNSVIFIDDLERISSEIKIEDVLGYLNNNFIEHNKIKVVLICDEEVLEKRENGTTPYLKIKEKLINRSVIFTLDVNEFIPDYLRERYSKANNNYYNLLLPQTDWII